MPKGKPKGSERNDAGRWGTTGSVPAGTHVLSVFSSFRDDRTIEKGNRRKGRRGRLPPDSSGTRGFPQYGFPTSIVPDTTGAHAGLGLEPERRVVPARRSG